jgi:hypothetical protein
MLWEMRNYKKYKVEPHIKKVICTMIVAVLGSEEEGGRRSRSTVTINNAMGPLITEGHVGVCCRSLQKLCAKVKEAMLRKGDPS